MKKKLVYLIVFIFCMNFLSSAKQNGQDCDRRFACPTLVERANKAVLSALAKKKEIGQLPFRLFIFNI